MGNAPLKLLLDTHVWVWSQEQPERLGPRTTKLLLSAAHENHVCAISTLEIARLVEAGAIALTTSLHDWVQQSLGLLAATTVPVTHDIALEAYALPPPFHRVPADRILVAAARLRDLSLVTADDRILVYRAVETRDARR